MRTHTIPMASLKEDEYEKEIQRQLDEIDITDLNEFELYERDECDESLEDMPAASPETGEEAADSDVPESVVLFMDEATEVTRLMEDCLEGVDDILETSRIQADKNVAHVPDWIKQDSFLRGESPTEMYEDLHERADTIVRDEADDEDGDLDDDTKRILKEMDENQAKLRVQRDTNLAALRKGELEEEQRRAEALNSYAIEEAKREAEMMVLRTKLEEEEQLVNNVLEEESERYYMALETMATKIKEERLKLEDSREIQRQERIEVERKAAVKIIAFFRGVAVRKKWAPILKVKIASALKSLEQDRVAVYVAEKKSEEEARRRRINTERLETSRRKKEAEQLLKTERLKKEADAKKISRLTSRKKLNSKSSSPIAAAFPGSVTDTCIIVTDAAVVANSQSESGNADENQKLVSTLGSSEINDNPDQGSETCRDAKPELDTADAAVVNGDDSPVVNTGDVPAMEDTDAPAVNAVDAPPMDVRLTSNHAEVNSSLSGLGVERDSNFNKALPAGGPVSWIEDSPRVMGTQLGDGDESTIVEDANTVNDMGDDADAKLPLDNNTGDQDKGHSLLAGCEIAPKVTIEDDLLTLEASISFDKPDMRMKLSATNEIGSTETHLQSTTEGKLLDYFVGDYAPGGGNSAAEDSSVETGLINEGRVETILLRDSCQTNRVINDAYSTHDEFTEKSAEFSRDDVSESRVIDRSSDKLVVDSSPSDSGIDSRGGDRSSDVWTDGSKPLAEAPVEAIENRIDVSVSLPPYLESMRLDWIQSRDTVRRSVDVPIPVVRRPRCSSRAKKLKPVSDETLIKSGGGLPMSAITTLTLNDMPSFNPRTISNCAQLASLTIDNCGLAAFDSLSELSFLRSLYLLNNKLDYVNLEFMSALVVVKLRDNHLSNFPYLKGCGRLNYIDVSHNNIGKIAGLDHVAKLLWLDASHNQLISSSGLHHTRSLLYINVSHNHLASLDISQLDMMQEIVANDNSIASMPATDDCVLINRLELRGNSIQVCNHASWLPMLESVSLGANQLEGPVSAGSFVKSLDISNNQIIEEAAFEDIGRVMPRLSTIDIRENPVMNNRAAIGRILRSCTSLRTLNGTCKLDLDKAAPVSGFERMTDSQSANLALHREAVASRMSASRQLTDNDFLELLSVFQEWQRLSELYLTMHRRGKIEPVDDIVTLKSVATSANIRIKPPLPRQQLGNPIKPKGTVEGVKDEISTQSSKKQSRITVKDVRSHLGDDNIPDSLLLRENSALKIQALWRGFSTRKMFTEAMDVSEDNIRQWAATKIQAMYRGYRVRDIVARVRQGCEEEFNSDLGSLEEIDLDEFNCDDVDAGWEPKTGRTSDRCREVAAGVVPPTAFIPLDGLEVDDEGEYDEEQQHVQEMDAKKSRIAEEWGFKNDNTAELMIRRARRMKNSSKKSLDAKQRLSLLRKLEKTVVPVVPVERESRVGVSIKGRTGENPIDNNGYTYSWVHQQAVNDYPFETERDSNRLFLRKGKVKGLERPIDRAKLTGNRVQDKSDNALEIMSIFSQSEYSVNGTSNLAGAAARLHSGGSNVPRSLNHESSSRRFSTEDILARTRIQLPPIKSVTGGVASGNPAKTVDCWRKNESWGDSGWGGGKKRISKR